MSDKTGIDSTSTTNLPAAGYQPPAQPPPGSGSGAMAKRSSHRTHPDDPTSAFEPTDLERELARQRQLDAGWSE
jgi:hypothetical protein